ncbi:MAG: hypothetical protein IPG08_02650 [Sphingobacteriaceae bacterium]|nr:hypothetical protein [Sphingobacteriaceae bacterium]
MFFSKKINVSWQYFIVFAAFLILFTSCKPTRRLQKDQYLLHKVKIDGYQSTKLHKEELEGFVKQKPNRKFFGVFPFFVGWHNMFNDSILQAKKEKRNEQYDIKNAKKIQNVNKKNSEREKKGKKLLEPKLLSKEEPTTRENIRNIGEAPVILIPY